MNYELLNAKILDQGGTGNILLAIVFFLEIGEVFGSMRRKCQEVGKGQ